VHEIDAGPVPWDSASGAAACGDSSPLERIPPRDIIPAGNMTHDASHSYTYDAENRLIKVDSGNTATYVYDALGRRARKTVGSTTTDYVYDPSGNVLAEVTNVCAPICWAAFYANMNGQPIAEYKNDTTYFFHRDHLGSTRLVTDPNKAVVQNLGAFTTNSSKPQVGPFVGAEIPGTSLAVGAGAYGTITSVNGCHE